MHLHASGLDATFGQPLLSNYAADVVCEDKVGLQDGQGLGMGVGAGLMDDDVQRSAVILDAGHLHVLLKEKEREGERKNKMRRRELDRRGSCIHQQLEWWQNEEKKVLNLHLIYFFCQVLMSSIAHTLVRKHCSKCVRETEEGHVAGG